MSRLKNVKIFFLPQYLLNKITNRMQPHTVFLFRNNINILFLSLI